MKQIKNLVYNLSNPFAHSIEQALVILISQPLHKPKSDAGLLKLACTQEMLTQGQKLSAVELLLADIEPLIDFGTKLFPVYPIRIVSFLEVLGVLPDNCLISIRLQKPPDIPFDLLYHDKVPFTMNYEPRTMNYKNRRLPDSNRRIEVLQTSALPLG